LLLCASGTSIAQSKKDIKKSDQLVEQGNREFGKKNYRAAIDNYTQAAALNPKNAKAHFWRGYAHYYLKETDQALADMNTAATLGFAPVEISKVRWYLNFEQKKYDDALADVNSALKVEPNNQMLVRAAADINYEKGNFREALQSYQNASLSSPNDGELSLRMAKAYQALGDSENQAKSATEAVAKRTLSLAEAFALQGDAYQKQRKFAEAAVAYRKAIDAKPETYANYRLLAEVYRADNKFDDAIDISKRGLRQFPLDGDI
jgi:tetratricopeptide (TPR) repeat protein